MVPRKSPVIRNGITYWKCSRCSELKEAIDFGKDKYAVNGLCSSCKICSREQSKKWQRENPEKTKAMQRAYLQSERGKKVRQKWVDKNRKRIVGYVMSHRQTERGQETYRKATDKYKENNPEKVRARELAYLARSRGDLIPEPCEVCGTTEDIQGHHDDYSKPLEVRWLCQTHHSEHHQNLKIGERNAQYILMDISPY